MDNQIQALFGSLINAIGTTIAAIGNTPSIIKSEEASTSLELVGGTLQATGGALVADSIKQYSLGKLGIQLKVIGNLITIIAIVATANEEDRIKLEIQESLTEATGGGLSFVAALEEEPTPLALYEIYGSFLETVGYSMVALAGIKTLRGEESETINTIGWWIEVIGSVIGIIGVAKGIRNESGQPEASWLETD
ncbi:hypothetical protein M2M59_04750 [Rummeliibacillus sp. G93]|uniref:DUF6944 family repetitive protein n=1 Tax=Rummeliibacillus sp. G93 TaxID=2939494 RepID=UPI00201BDDC2|nr:hypothetical protein [Rummeliibacillus sp. G93]UQW98325.1 hypothetical protein M2M59_04750 [Rummeliibacillus sp. G93]